MNHLAYCVAIYALAYHNHSGQSSKGYRLLCLACERVRREHSALSLGRVVEELGLIGGDTQLIERGKVLYPKDGKFRQLVAMYLHHLRKHRERM